MSASNFFNQDLLTKRGALAQVWMASHLSTKLSKQALTSTSIPKSVQSILGTQLASMAIRLSGQLLLGIARIYSRKTKYLLDDAQETLGKVKKAFQNEGRAAVDLPEDHHVSASGDDRARGGNRDINLRREGGDLEDLLGVGFGMEEEWSLEKYLAENTGKDKGKGKSKALTANLADITLDESHNDPGYFDYDDLDGLGGNVDFDLGLDADFALFDGDDELNNLAGPSRPNKRVREDGEEEDDENREEGDLSVELGRDAAPHLSSDRGSLGPVDFSKNKDLDDAFGMLAPENGPDDLGGFDGGFDAGFDLGLDGEFGGGLEDDGERLPSVDPYFGSRNGSVAPTAAGTEAADSLQLTPRAAAAVNAREGAAAKQPAKKRQKAIAIDKVIELDWQAARLAGNSRFKEPEFLPRSRLHLALLSPDVHLSLLPQAVPKTSKKALAIESFAPPGFLARELRDLFNMPTRRERIKLEGRERREKEDRPVELGRRAASVFSNVSNNRIDARFGDDFVNMDFGGGGEEEELDLGFGLAPEDEGLGGFDGGNDFDLDLGLDDEAEGGSNARTPTKRAKKAKTSHSRDSEREVTPARSIGSGRGIFEDDEKIYRSEGPLAIFDEIGSGRTVASATSVATLTPSRSLGASQSLATEAEEAAAAAGQSQGDSLTQKSGSISLQSKNTRKAVKVIQEQLEEDEKVEFNRVADKASRRAASSFFFELLVLSSADVIKVKQQEAFADIHVRGTDRLREIAL